MSQVILDLPGYEGLYQACSSGQIWSVSRFVVAGRHKHGLIKRGGRYLKPSFYGRYPIVTLSKEGCIKYFTLHSLIALAFLGPRPDRHVINHIDGDRLNNRPDNLEYCTPQENVEHAEQIGLVNRRGVNNPNYKHGKSKNKDYVNNQYNKRYFSKQYEAV